VVRRSSKSQKAEKPKIKSGGGVCRTQLTVLWLHHAVSTFEDDARGVGEKRCQGEEDRRQDLHNVSR